GRGGGQPTHTIAHAGRAGGPLAGRDVSCYPGAAHGFRGTPAMYLRLLLPLLAVAWLGGLPLAAAAAPDVTERARRFVKDPETSLRPLDGEAGRAWWDANISGKDEDFKRKEEAQNRIDAALSDPKVFAEIKDLKDKSKDIDDPVTRRAVDVLYLLYLEKQV